MDIKELQEMNIHELVEVARGMNIEAVSTLRKSELIFKILEGQTEKNGLIYAEGVLQVLAEGYGFLRSAKYNYLPGPDDIYLSPSQIKKFDLRTGDMVIGQVRPPKDNEKYFGLLRVEAVNGLLGRGLEKTGTDKGDIGKVTVVGNTTMQHLFAGLHPEKLGAYPYLPESCSARVCTAESPSPS